MWIKEHLTKEKTEQDIYEIEREDGFREEII